MSAESITAVGPKPIGVSSGPFSATRVSRIEAMVSGGTPLGMPSRNTAAPARRSSRAVTTPVASIAR